MTKEYPEQLGAWLRRRQTSRRDRNLAAFLAAADDVRAALRSGYPMKTIWTNLFESKRIAFRYDAFLRYVHRYIFSADGSSPYAPNQKQPPQKIIAATSSKHQAGFMFNPVPNKEELL